MIHAPSKMEQFEGIIAKLQFLLGVIDSPEVAPYCASKWGSGGSDQSPCSGITHGLATVAFNPGVIDTKILLQPSVMRQVHMKSQMNRLACCQQT